MQKIERKVLLNRPVFTQKVFESRSLSVLTTLLHRFPEVGQYQVRVRHPKQPEQAFTVRVSADFASQQVNVDLATLSGNGGCCGCEDSNEYKLVVGGVIGFYASSGVGGYEVTVSHHGDKEKQIVLDNSKVVPAGDLFAVTLTRPGIYQLLEDMTKAVAEVRVSLPKGGRIRTDQPTLIVLNRKGFKDKAINIMAGQSLVVLCEVEAQLRVELTKTENSDQRPTQEGSLTVRRYGPVRDER